MLYLKLFNTESERTAFTENYDYVSYTKETDKVHINEEVHDYSLDYLTLVAKSSGTLKFSGVTPTQNIQYSIDGGETWSEDMHEPIINVNAGDKVLWKGTITPQYYYGIGKFGGTSTFDIEGNVMSLLFGDDFVGQTDISDRKFINAFLNLFYSTNCISAANLIIPATKLCDACYYQMFGNCQLLTTAPQLPATTLVNGCYSAMFNNCTNLNYIKMLATDISASGCMDNWVFGVASNGTFVKASSMTSLPSGDSGIPNGWTVIDA